MPCFSTKNFILAMALGSRESEEINPEPYWFMSQRHSSGKHRHRHGAFRLRSLPRTFRPQTHKKDSIRFCAEARKFGFCGRSRNWNCNGIF
jgi:hypothetical protein